MGFMRAGKGGVGRISVLLATLVLLSACSTTTVIATAPPPPSPPAEDDDLSQLIAQLRNDLSIHAGRVGDRTPSLSASTDNRRERDREFSERAKALFAPLSGGGLFMPVVGVQPRNLTDSWGNPRDGGKRKHRGIDIFAPRGTPVVAVADGIVSYIGIQPKGGQCLWLTTERGVSFYYAHLDRWAAGLYEGMEVRKGDLLGYVGNTGNARTTPPHLHFAVNQNDEMVNPYPLLTRAMTVQRARVAVESGAAMGTR